MSEEEAGSAASRQKHSRAPFLHRRSSPHDAADAYDHAIGLIDSTIANADSSGNQTPEPLQHTQTTDEAAARRRDRVRASVRGEYNRQKWRRYQKERYSQGETDEEAEEGNEGQAQAARQSKDTYGVSTLRRNYDRVRDKIPIGQKAKEKARNKEEFEIDILYENQRGSFFCGIPLYSHQSLLNFDPPAWQTREFKDSPVNITNAQPPDPMWAWAWRCWYVDMSHDVDEEGWEYSFSFRQGFAWHGTHPWFHSFVRRRRWLRKRVKIKPKIKEPRDALHRGHKLDLDYFTIHSTPRETSTDRVPTIAEASTGSNQRYSLITSRNYASEEESESPEEITDVNGLLTALRMATVDRKKLGAVRNFLSNAGPELHYLPDRIPEIMDLFIYQTSRQQVVLELQRAIGTDKYTSKEGEVSSESDGANDQRVDTETADGSKEDQLRSLEKAVQIAHDRVRHFEYWSDIKETLAEGEALDAPPPPPEGIDLALTTGKSRPPAMPRQKSEGRVQIKGIPEGARVGEKVGIAKRVTMERQQQPENIPLPEDEPGLEVNQEDETTSNKDTTGDPEKQADTGDEENAESKNRTMTVVKI